MAAQTERWTIRQLGQVVVDTLAAVDYERPDNHQISALPDPRTIRYYASLGLVDRPAEMRGRTAYYGRRHLLQLVAIKQLQGRGLSLTEIQAELAGADDRRLARVADLPEELPASLPEPARAPESRAERAPEVAASRRRSGFWAQRPIATPAAERSDAALDDEPPAPAPVDAAPLSVGVPLTGGVTLLLAPERALTTDDLAAIRTAGRQISRLLASRGLIPTL